MTAARFARPLRVTRPRDFEAVFENGKRIAEGKLVALVGANTLDHPRLGLAVSKKVARHAVDRNRIKRHARESFRVSRAALPAVDIVILARPGSGAADAAELRSILERLWNRIRLQCAPA